MIERIWTSDLDKLDSEEECSPQLVEDHAGMQDARRDSSHGGARVGLAETRSQEGARVNLARMRLQAMSARRTPSLVTGSLRISPWNFLLRFCGWKRGLSLMKQMVHNYAMEGISLK
ncbi:hypothetical protein GOBAR_DD04127 [Gossypium barbadense]|nr:hypothetical protein GOBAR_DD04127 [Gossypium barbadense]